MKKPLLLAHRGFSGLYPENTRVAFRAAVEKTDCDGFESDVHFSKDGKLVIVHDAVLGRTSNGTGYIKDYTYEELQRLDLGSWKSPEFAGESMMLFDELLDFCKETKKVLNMELKNYEVFYEGLEQAVIDAIVRHKMEDMVFVSTFNHISMQNFKKLNPEIKTGLLYDKPLWDMANYITRGKADNMHPRYMLLQYQPELVKLFHDSGMGVNTWTVNEEADMRDMIGRGVDSIISNFPDLLCKVAAEMCGE